MFPSGTVTFLLTDVQGSTRLWDQFPDQARRAMARHDELIEGCVQRFGGVVVRPRGEGDSRFAVFSRATDAVATACAIQIALSREAWPPPVDVRVRIGVHTGEADLRDGDYYGTAVNRCARLRAIAHGGQVLLSAVTLALVRDHLPQDAGVIDLGSHLLSGLNQPEHVFQLLHPALQSDFPPLTSVDGQRTNLPSPTTAFIGRERELVEIRELIDSARLVTLTGAGGAGKSRLATQVGAQLLEQFEDGVWLADLSPLGDGALVLRAVALAVGVVEEPRRPLLETLQDNLRLKHTLIILDNCEQFVRSCATLADALLRACPRLRVLVTSREPLGCGGEVPWPVPALAGPEAMMLFVDRARASRPGFRLNDGDASAVAEMCRRLDGMPLAIELAAARARVLSPRQIADRLDDRFRLLTGGSRTAPPRQQTLRAAIDWSHDLLSSAEQALFARLSVFAGGFDLAAAEGVCAFGAIDSTEVLNLLSQLVDKSLVTVDHSARSSPVRYRLPETLRQYARERLVARGELEPIRRQHANHFVVHAQLAEPHLRGPEQAHWLDSLEDDHDNLLAGLKWAAESGEIEAGLQLGNGIVRFWLIRHPREGGEWLPLLLSLPGTADPSLRGRALYMAGNLAALRGDLDQAVALQAESVRMWRETGDKNQLSKALNIHGGMSLEAGHLVSARSSLEESLALRRAQGDPRDIGVGLANLAELERRCGNLPGASALGADALSIARGCGDDTVVATALNNLSMVAMVQGRYDEATRLLEEAAATFDRLGDQRNVAECCQRLALVACSCKEGHLAARLLGASSAARESVQGSSTPLFPDGQSEFERGEVAARELLGAEEYARASAEGRAARLGSVLNDAISVLREAPSDRLTERQKKFA